MTKAGSDCLKKKKKKTLKKNKKTHKEEAAARICRSICFVRPGGISMLYIKRRTRTKNTPGGFFQDGKYVFTSLRTGKSSLTHHNTGQRCTSSNTSCTLAGGLRPLLTGSTATQTQTGRLTFILLYIFHLGSLFHLLKCVDLCRDICCPS